MEQQSQPTPRKAAHEPADDAPSMQQARRWMRMMKIAFTADIVILILALVLLYCGNRGMIPVVWMWVAMAVLALALVVLCAWVFGHSRDADYSDLDRARDELKQQADDAE